MALPSIKRNIAYSTLYQVLTLALPFITTPYVSRVLGAEGIGVYSFTSSIVAYFTLFAALGTATYGAREISMARDDKEKFSRLFWEIECLSILTSTICIALWSIWVFCAPEYNVIYLILTMSLLGTMADISWFFTGLEQFKYIVIRNSIVKIVGVILLFVFIKEKNDLCLYVFLMTFINLLGALSMWMYIPKMVNKIDVRSVKLKRHFKETLVYFIPSIATSIYLISNKALLGFIGSDMRENGYYEQTTKIVQIAQTLSFLAINNVLGSRISYLFAQNKINEVRQRIDWSLNFILLMGFGFCFGLIAIASKFIPLFLGGDFFQVIVLLQMLCPIIPIIGISNCLGTHYYTPAGLRKQSAKYIICGTITNLILNVILIPFYGAKGAVCASLASELCITTLYFLNCKGMITLTQLFRNGWKKFLSALFMAVAIVFTSDCIENRLLAVITPIVVGCSVYVLCLFILRDGFVIETSKRYCFSKR